MSKEKKDLQNIFELLLRDLALTFDPETFSFTLKFPAFNHKPYTGFESSAGKEIQINPSHLISSRLDEKDITKSDFMEKKEHQNQNKVYENLESVDLSLDDLNPELEPSRVKIHLKAYLKLALHALKYANPDVPQNEWIEVIGLLTGHIESNDTPLACLVIEDAFPIGHGTNVNTQINDPQSMVRVYNEIKSHNKRQIILGWYHSHPSYGAFMSQTDYETQVRYQRLGAQNSQFAAPVALVIDPTKISSSSYGFKIFRLKEDMKTWEEPHYQVLNCPLESLPEMMNTLLPLAEEKGRMFLEYDYEK
ncbi:MAG: Mov34/MPN/PAD-1 family protein [Candidatus Heimdallarchaeota archaeon]|nr:MAG: Mov34/MPN/PAD-1 family protein [Candidatus Heimdallarchaeota archaeon]